MSRPYHSLPIYWLGRPEKDDEERNHSEDYRAMRFRVTDNWISVDSDQWIVPAKPLWRVPNDPEDQARIGLETDFDAGLIKQYGGESLRNDFAEAFLALDVDQAKGTEWVLEYLPAAGFGVVHVSEWEPRTEWLAADLEDVDD